MTYAEYQKMLDRHTELETAYQKAWKDYKAGNISHKKLVQTGNELIKLNNAILEIKYH